MTDPSKRLIVGISGASGVIYGAEILKVLRQLGIETHVVLSDAAKTNFRIETNITIADITQTATCVYGERDLAAPIASGSFPTLGMVVIPCSIKSLSGIANSFNVNLLMRAADVTLKERRPLVLAVRETPLHQGHLKLMLDAARLGAVILPPVPAFYHHPQTILDLIHHTIGKILDCFQIPHHLFDRWGEDGTE
ncbi:3-octaprenyl-4-hydroxybenzoate carboxy-lyase [Desulfosarcina cetonica]|uniref:UbiX family flavin prenyltransferase n=1 Tax=Desulfosarcina cetonica TaxID=90730 RepID=UPI0006D156EE|nr:UbiX family flavin prenyltransferase [Desulfosarcina cetonica]VTR71173.1 3-octaprenyl-4-hydroxybenzoate carboxy-lyase [Desulfosarcina cetonica]